MNALRDPDFRLNESTSLNELSNTNVWIEDRLVREKAKEAHEVQKKVCQSIPNWHN